MAGAAEKLGVRLSEVEVKTPAFDVIANVDAAVHTAPDDIRTVLARQAASPVQWVKTVHAMKAMGVTHVVECGPGKVLTGLIRRVDPTIETANISSVDAIAALLEKTVSALKTQIFCKEHEECLSMQMLLPGAWRS